MGRLHGTPRGRPGASVIDTNLLKRVGAAQLIADCREAEISTCLSTQPSTEAAVAAGEVGRQGLAQEQTWPLSPHRQSSYFSLRSSAIRSEICVSRVIASSTACSG
jgi:hypothetical protein